MHDRLVWVWDNSHDIVVARMVEAADDLPLSAAVVARWRVCASVADHAVELPGPGTNDVSSVLEALALARVAIDDHGDVVRADLKGWSVLDGVDVSNGFLRGERLPVAALLDVVSGFEGLLTDTLAPDPPNAFWLLGASAGRSTVGKAPA